HEVSPEADLVGTPGSPAATEGDISTTDCQSLDHGVRRHTGHPQTDGHRNHCSLTVFADADVDHFTHSEVVDLLNVLGCILDAHRLILEVALEELFVQGFGFVPCHL